MPVSIKHRDLKGREGNKTPGLPFKNIWYRVHVYTLYVKFRDVTEIVKGCHPRCAEYGTKGLYVALLSLISMLPGALSGKSNYANWLGNYIVLLCV